MVSKIKNSKEKLKTIIEIKYKRDKDWDNKIKEKMIIDFLLLF